MVITAFGAQFLHLVSQDLDTFREGWRLFLLAGCPSVWLCLAPCDQLRWWQWPPCFSAEAFLCPLCHS